MKRKALGKGLKSLIPEPPTRKRPLAETPDTLVQSPRSDLQKIDIDRIQPNRSQPRQDFDQAGLEELARSLRQQGVLQPVVVRPASYGNYELVAGERRWRAAQLAGLLKIPAMVRNVEDCEMLEYALIENIQREELNPIEAAQAFQTLIDDLGLTQNEVAQRIGKQRATVANLLRLLNLPTTVQDKIRSGQLSAGHAKALASLSSPRDQNRLAERIVRESLSVRQIETLVARTIKVQSGDGKTVAAKLTRDPNTVAAEEELQRVLGTKVRIERAGKGGRLELHFFGEEELERLYQLVLRAGRKPHVSQAIIVAD